MVAREVITPVPVTGRRRPRREKYTQKTVRRALLSGGCCAVAVLAYTLPFAGVTQEGYQQHRKKIELQTLARENECLRAEVALLKNPQRVEVYAQAHGMVMRDQARFITLALPKKAPQPRRSLLARWSPFAIR